MRMPSALRIMEFFALLGGGQKDAGLDGSGRPVARLAILPGLTHYSLSSSPALTTALTPFLDAPMPGACLAAGGGVLRLMVLAPAAVAWLSGGNGGRSTLAMAGRSSVSAGILWLSS